MQINAVAVRDHRRLGEQLGDALRAGRLREQRRRKGPIETGEEIILNLQKVIQACLQVFGL